MSTRRHESFPAAVGALLLAATLCGLASLLGAVPGKALPPLTAPTGLEDPGRTAGASSAPAVLPDPPLRLRVNIPAFRLDALVHGQPAASYPVSVGTRAEPTPHGRYEIDRVIWNPWWHPPAHRRPRDKVTRPGPRNPMGRVKLQFSSVYYVHGTAKEHEIGRAVSRGCVRLRNDDAVALARLVHQHAGSGVAATDLEALIRDPSRTRHLKLAQPIPIELAYELVELRDGDLVVHPDVYGLAAGTREELALAALEAAGIPSAAIDREVVARHLAGEPSFTLPLADLVLPGFDLPESGEVNPSGG